MRDGASNDATGQPMQAPGRPRQLTEQEIEALYASIGRFAVKFEQVCHSMCSAIIFIFHGEGVRNQFLTQAALAGLTADPLLRMMTAMIAEVRKGLMTPDDEKILRTIHKEVRALIEERNDVIHRAWYPLPNFAGVGQAELVGFKFKNTSEGPKFAPLKYSTEVFDKLSETAERLASTISGISGQLSFDIRIPFTQNFEIADGVVRQRIHAGEASAANKPKKTPS